MWIVFSCRTASISTVLGGVTAGESPLWTRLRATIAVFLLLAVGSPSEALAQRSLKLERQRAHLMLKTVSKYIQRDFHDPDLKGVDWEALVAQASDQIDSVETPGEMYSAIFAVVNALQDSHTVFAPPRRQVRYRFGFEAQAYGEEVLVSEVESNGAASRAGLQPGDRLLLVNGFNARRESFDLMMIFFRALRPVAEMELVFEREGKTPQMIRVIGDAKREALVTDLTDIDNVYQLIREAQSEEEQVVFGTLDPDISYLKLAGFRGDDHALKILAKKLKKAPAMVVDLRGNPGGTVWALKYFLGFFETEKTTIAQFVRRDKIEPVEVKPQTPNLAGPLFILVDAQTSSAAEIFARYFQRLGRATVIGDRTSGRVTVARYHPFEVGAGTVVVYGLQLATARVVFPGGEELEGSGVIPDKHCLPSREDLRLGRDRCLEVARAAARQALSVGH